MLRLLDNTQICLQICQLETICVVVRWILENLLLVRRPWHLPLYLCHPLVPWSIRCKTTPTRLSSIPDLVSESVGRGSDVPSDESSAALGSVQTSPREFTRSQGELVPSSSENADLATVIRRVAGKRTTILPVLLAFSDNVDSVSVPDSFLEVEIPVALSPLKVTRRNVEWNLSTNR